MLLLHVFETHENDQVTKHFFGISFHFDILELLVNSSELNHPSSTDSILLPMLHLSNQLVFLFRKKFTILRLMSLQFPIALMLIYFVVLVIQMEDTVERLTTIMTVGSKYKN